MSDWVHQQGCRQVSVAAPQATWAMSHDMQRAILDRACAIARIAPAFTPGSRLHSLSCGTFVLSDEYQQIQITLLAIIRVILAILASQ
jgi:hypothetical protein